MLPIAKGPFPCQLINSAIKTGKKEAGGDTGGDHKGEEAEEDSGQGHVGPIHELRARGRWRPR